MSPERPHVRSLQTHETTIQLKINLVRTDKSIYAWGKLRLKEYYQLLPLRLFHEVFNCLGYILSKQMMIGERCIAKKWEKSGRGLT
jgi:hypothetical protein